jgi:DNA invertase Pin-like site-specific DNA recombinase
MKDAAIYARTSTGHINDGLNRQIDHAKAYAAEQGWAVADEHIFVDAGPSGVQYEERPGFSRLMNVLKPRPPFHVLIMAEVSRLGRDQVKIAEALEQLAEAGVQVCCYGAGRERTLDAPTHS